MPAPAEIPATTLIWHKPPGEPAHHEWLRFLVAPLAAAELHDLTYREIRRHAIILEGNKDQSPPEFLALVDAHRPVALFHFGDQYFGYDYAHYRHYSCVIKTHWSPVFRHPRLMVVPIGYQSGFAFHATTPPASTRPLVWSFAGEMKASRVEMAQAFAELRPHRVHATGGVAAPLPHLGRGDYLDLLEQSVFAPCPMGNVIIESHRLYESLEAGCIPIVETRPLIRYYETLLEDPPLMFVRSWAEARQRAAGLLADPQRLDRLQAEVSQWWQDYKRRLQARVCEFIRAAFAQPAAAAPIRLPPQVFVPGWRHLELLKHQTMTSLLWRVRRNILTGRLSIPK